MSSIVQSFSTAMNATELLLHLYALHENNQEAMSDMKGEKRNRENERWMSVYRDYLDMCDRHHWKYPSLSDCRARIHTVFARARLLLEAYQCAHFSMPQVDSSTVSTTLESIPNQPAITITLNLQKHDPTRALIQLEPEVVELLVRIVMYQDRELLDAPPDEWSARFEQRLQLSSSAANTWYTRKLSSEELKELLLVITSAIGTKEWDIIESLDEDKGKEEVGAETMSHKKPPSPVSQRNLYSNPVPHTITKAAPLHAMSISNILSDSVTSSPHSLRSQEFPDNTVVARFTPLGGTSSKLPSIQTMHRMPSTDWEWCATVHLMRLVQFERRRVVPNKHHMEYDEALWLRIYQKFTEDAHFHAWPHMSLQACQARVMEIEQRAQSFVEYHRRVPLIVYLPSKEPHQAANFCWDADALAFLTELVITQDELLDAPQENWSALFYDAMQELGVPMHQSMVPVTGAALLATINLIIPAVGLLEWKGSNASVTSRMLSTERSATSSAVLSTSTPLLTSEIPSKSISITNSSSTTNNQRSIRDGNQPAFPTLPTFSVARKSTISQPLTNFVPPSTNHAYNSLHGLARAATSVEQPLTLPLRQTRTFLNSDENEDNLMEGIVTNGNKRRRQHQTSINDDEVEHAVDMDEKVPMYENRHNYSPLDQESKRTSTTADSAASSSHIVQDKEIVCSSA